MVDSSHMDQGILRRIQPQERDFQILRGLYESRLMTIGHTAKLYFDGRLEAARKRIQKLKQAGFVRDRKQGPCEPMVQLLTKRGFEFLKYHDRFDGLPVVTNSEFESRCRVSALTLRHELAVMDVKAALIAAISCQPNIRIVEGSTWPRLSQFRTHQPSLSGYGTIEISVQPDGFLCLHERDENGIAEHNLFLEVDRGTESQRVFATKAHSYRTYYRNGGFAESRGGSRDAFGEYPFRVLAVFKTRERRNNTAKRLLELETPIKTMVWMATISDVQNDPLGTIWTLPEKYGTDYRSIFNY